MILNILLFLLLSSSVLGNINLVDSIIYNVKELTLNTTNVITIKGKITDELASNFIYELNQKKEKENIFVYIDTNGGSVDAGNKIVDEIQNYKLDCVADRAISMGFVILQSCYRRYITQYGILMQHQMSYDVMGEKEKVESYVQFISQISDNLQDMQALKIGITRKKLKELTYNDWWLFGENAISENCVDGLIKIKCDHELTNLNYTEDRGSYTYTYSKCPLVKNHIDKKKNKKESSFEDYFVFV